MTKRTTNLSEERRRELFAKLVTLQTAGLAERSSREWVARDQKVSEEAVEAIEREGRENGWPPLDKNKK